LNGRNNPDFLALIPLVSVALLAPFLTIRENSITCPMAALRGIRPLKMGVAAASPNAHFEHPL
jgi:hypothetical protein